MGITLTQRPGQPSARSPPYRPSVLDHRHTRSETMRRLTAYAALAVAVLGMPAAPAASTAPPAVPTCFASDGSVPTPTLVGTPGNDVLVGTPGDDVILGLSGNDVIYARGGDDVLCGSAGGDRIFGGPGRDVLDGADVDLADAAAAG